jgi:hypothetical protein
MVCANKPEVPQKPSTRITESHTEAIEATFSHLTCSSSHVVPLTAQKPLLPPITEMIWALAKQQTEAEDHRPMDVAADLPTPESSNSEDSTSGS